MDNVKKIHNVIFQIDFFKRLYKKGFLDKPEDNRLSYPRPATLTKTIVRP